MLDHHERFLEAHQPDSDKSNQDLQAILFELYGLVVFNIATDVRAIYNNTPRKFIHIQGSVTFNGVAWNSQPYPYGMSPYTYYNATFPYQGFVRNLNSGGYQNVLPLPGNLLEFTNLPRIKRLHGIAKRLEEDIKLAALMPSGRPTYNAMQPNGDAG